MLVVIHLRAFAFLCSIEKWKDLNIQNFKSLLLFVGVKLAPHITIT
jgi:hypothetical protein